MTPLGELRVSLPAALTVYRLDWRAAYLISVVGNIVPVIIILLFLGPVSGWLSKKSVFFQKFFDWLFKKTRQKYDSRLGKIGLPGLTAFVALPFPLTGGWTGAIIAFLLGIPFKVALPLIATGVVMAGVIVLAVTQTGITIEKYFGWPVLVGISSFFIFCWLMFKKVKKKNDKPS